MPTITWDDNESDEFEICANHTNNVREWMVHEKGRYTSDDMPKWAYALTADPDYSWEDENY